MRLSRCCRSLKGATSPLRAHQQLAVEHGIEVEPADHVGKAVRYVVARARIEMHLAGPRHDLHADAVPLPFGGEIGGFERLPIGILQRMRQHQRPEGWRTGHVRPRSAPLEPGEQRLVRRRERVPDLLDIADGKARHLGRRRLGKARRYADAQRAGQQLDERPPPCRVERIEPGLQPRPQVVAPDQRQLRDDVGEAWRSPLPACGERDRVRGGDKLRRQR